MLKRTAVLDHDVAGLAGGLGADDAFHRSDLAHERRLILVGVDWHVILAVPRRGLEEVGLLGRDGQLVGRALGVGARIYGINASRLASRRLSGGGGASI